MIGPPENFERIDLKRADDPRDVVHRAVAAIAQGSVVRLPAGRFSYAWAASALAPAAIERLEGAGAKVDRPYVLAVRGAPEVRDWVPGLSPTGRRLTRRAWPGPLEIRFDDPTLSQGLVQRLSAPARERLLRGSALCLGRPEHRLLHEVLGLVQGPILLAPVVDASLPGPQGRSGDLWIDDSPAQAHDATLVALRGGSWQIERPGALGRADLQRMAGMLIVFVCTGNTCRSPLAEALCRLAVARRLSCDPAQIEERGYVVMSAGLAAGIGAPAAREAIEIVAARGGSLQHHASRRLTYELADQADWLVTMTDDHRQAILEAQPALKNRVRLLHGSGEDIDDPIGRGREVYEHTAADIERQLAHLLDDIGVKAHSGS